MVFYFSERAFAELSGDDALVSIVTRTRSAELKVRASQFGSQKSHEVEERESDVARVDRWLKSLSKKRHVARDLWSAVSPTQVIDVHVDLEYGVMPFMWLPDTGYGESRINGPIRAFWATGKLEGRPENADATASIVLVGSLDNLPGRSFLDAKNDPIAHSYPSDPYCLTSMIIDELDLNADAKTVEAATGFEISESQPGDRAVWAWEQSLRAREPRSGVPGRISWVLGEHRPEQRVVAVVTDVSPAGSAHHVVLARPLLIDSTI
jgi:hypothetical protein